MGTFAAMLDAVRVQDTKPFAGINAADTAMPILEDAYSLLVALEMGWLNEGSGGDAADHMATLDPDHHAAALRSVARLVALAAAVVREG